MSSFPFLIRTNNRLQTCDLKLATLNTDTSITFLLDTASHYQPLNQEWQR